MSIPLGETVFFDCITSDFAGTAKDADVTPTFAVFENATDTDIGVGGILIKRSGKTGNYRGSFVVSEGNGFEVGKWYSVIGSATVNGVAGKSVLKDFDVSLNEGGPGSISHLIIINDSNSLPLSNVKVWVSTDEAGANVVAGSLMTDAFGRVTFMLDPGTYYVWRSRPGYNFTNPQTIAVS